MVAVIVLAAVWLVCGVLAWGLSLGDFTRRYPDMDNTDVARIMAVAGPFGLLAELLHLPTGFRLKPLTKEQRWAEFNKLYPYLTREYFEKRRA